MIWNANYPSYILLFPGVNPRSIRGSRTGVFIGCTESDAFNAWTTDIGRVKGYELTGSDKSMMANLLSYFFDFNGVYCACTMFTLFHC